MRVLILDRYCPGPFRLLGPYLVQQGHAVTFVSEFHRKDFTPPGMHFMQVKASPVGKLAGQEDARERVLLTLMRRGEAFFRGMRKVKALGFEPDIVLGNGADGSILNAHEVFNCPLIGYFPWYFNAETDSDEEGFDFAPLRLRNMFQLDALMRCSGGLTGTLWQQQSYPEPVRKRVHVQHEGVDTAFFSPEADSLVLNRNGLSLRLGGAGSELVTYTARNLTTNSGADVLLRALPQVLKRRPQCHALIVAREPLRDGSAGFAELRQILAAHPRAHFTDLNGYTAYRSILRASTVHVFLSGPIMLSTSLLEAMSCGSLVVASDTPPVREIITHGENGLLTPYPDPQALADTLCHALENKSSLAPLRENARETILRQYDSTLCLPVFQRILREFSGIGD